MTRTNLDIVKGYIEEVINQKHFERLSEFCSEDCVTHSPPYVGLGITADDSSGVRVTLTQIAPHGPAAGHLQVGDELVRIHDNDRAWETFDEIKNGLWGQGILGTELFVTVRRHGNLLTIPLKRSRIDEFDIKLSEAWATVEPYFRKYWPDLQMEIKEIFEAGDMVTCYAVNSGLNLEHNRPAIWGEIDIFKVKNGEITEIWSIENTFSELKQLGYQITEPVREVA